MRIATRTLLTLILVLALVPPAAAQGRPNIGQVVIIVKDIDSKEEIGSVEPGGAIILPAGSHVRLIMTALPTGRARGPLYPDTVFRDTSAGGVTITRSNVENSTADLVLNRTKAGSRTETIRYRITESWVPAALRTGSFNIHIAPPFTSYDHSAGTSLRGAVPGRSRAGELTRMLYEAILLREPDPGAAGTVEAIAGGGYDSLTREAVNIANSEESRIRLYDQGTTNEQRLAALYRNLLDLSPGEVDRAQYYSDLRRLNDGRIADVVWDLVNSDRFRDRIGVVR